jgi:hypothetical protein
MFKTYILTRLGCLNLDLSKTKSKSNNHSREASEDVRESKGFLRCKAGEPERDQYSDRKRKKIPSDKSSEGNRFIRQMQELAEVKGGALYG